MVEAGGVEGRYQASKFDCRWNVKQVQTAAASGNRPSRRTDRRSQMKPQKGCRTAAEKSGKCHARGENIWKIGFKDIDCSIG